MRRSFVLAFTVAALFAFSAQAVAAEIHVLSDGTLEPALAGLAEAFRRQSGHEVKVRYVFERAIKPRVLRGESVDIVIAKSRDVESFSDGNKLLAGSQVEITRIGIGLAAREQASLPDISTVAALKQALLGADSVVYSTRASGIYFASVIERLHIADALKSKSVRFQSSATVFDEVLKRRGNDIAIGLTNHILAYAPRGLRLLGPLPGESQSYLAYAAVLTSDAKSPVAANAFIQYLASPAARSALVAIGAD